MEVLDVWDIQKNMDSCGMIFNVKITLLPDYLLVLFVKVG